MSEWPDNLLKNDLTNVSRCLLAENLKFLYFFHFFGLLTELLKMFPSTE